MQLNNTDQQYYLLEVSVLLLIRVEQEIPNTQAGVVQVYLCLKSEIKKEISLVKEYSIIALTHVQAYCVRFNEHYAISFTVSRIVGVAV